MQAQPGFVAAISRARPAYIAFRAPLKYKLGRRTTEDPHVEEGWERQPQAELSLQELECMVQPAFPGASISEYPVIATGLANTNVRFRLQERGSAYVLRIHTREPKAAAREQGLMNYLASNTTGLIPVAPLVYCDPAPR